MIADAHVDTLSKLLRLGLPFGRENEATHADLPRMLCAGLSLQVCALFTSPNRDRSAQMFEILRQAAFARREFTANSDRVELALSRQQVSHLQPGKLTVLLSVEGGGALGGDLAMLDVLYLLGVRALTLTWNARNELGDGVGEGSAAGGLTRFGREVVGKMQQRGMVVDVSHLSEAGFWDVLSTTDVPVIASHSNARALCDHPRNLTDKQLRALGERGGFVGLNFCPSFLHESGRASIDDLVRHAVHIAETAGPGSLGFGTDFDGIEALPSGIGGVTDLKRVAARLEKEFSPEELTGICGTNLQRTLASILPEG